MCAKETGLCLIRCTLHLALLVSNYFRGSSSLIYPQMPQLTQVFSARLTFNSRIFISSFQPVVSAESKKTMIFLRRRSATTCSFPLRRLQGPNPSTPLVVPQPRLSYPRYQTGLIETGMIPI